MKRPTDNQWEICLNCLDMYLDHLRENEPQALQTIGALERLSLDLPFDASEAFGDSE